MRLIVYRNCFTGDVSGGDTHMSGFLSWLLHHRPAAEAILVLPRGDGQAKVYPEVGRIKTISHPDTRLQSPLALMYIARALQAASRVNQFVDSSDVLVASSHFLPDVLPIAMAHVRRQAKVVFIHHIIADMDRPRSLNTMLANLQERLCFAFIRHRFGKIVVVNQAVADRLRQLGFRRQQMLLSSNFVQPSAQPQNYGHKDITLLFCGRMVAQKGVDDFVNVCQQLRAQFADFRAVMIGVGPELERLRQLVATQELPITLAGYVDDDTKFDLMARAKLFVFPSVEEGWGIAVAEALAVGTPVVAYDLPVYQAVFSGQLHVVPLKDITALTTMSAELLRAYQGAPATYHAEQKQIISYADQFRVEAVAAKEYSFIGAQA